MMMCDMSVAYINSWSIGAILFCHSHLFICFLFEVCFYLDLGPTKLIKWFKTK